jgi:leucine dehydrogenase
MTYKNAIANIPYGGGKAVIIADPRIEKTTELLYTMGDFVQSLKGRYTTSFDSGTTLDDVRTIGERTEFAAGTLAAAGNASGSTANGVYYCMRAAAERVHGTSDLAGLTVAIQGVGNVGARLARRLAADGVRLVIADLDEAIAQQVANETGAAIAGIDEILGTPADIVAPCALGSILSAQSIPKLKAKIVVGGANNQLASADDDGRLQAADILYCPDYLANAGGIIDLYYQRSNWTSEAVDEHVASLAVTFHEIVDRSEAMHLGTARVADAIACERFNKRELA